MEEYFICLLAPDYKVQCDKNCGLCDFSLFVSYDLVADNAIFNVEDK